MLTPPSITYNLRFINMRLCYTSCHKVRENDQLHSIITSTQRTQRPTNPRPLPPNRTRDREFRTPAAARLVYPRLDPCTPRRSSMVIVLPSAASTCSPTQRTLGALFPPRRSRRTCRDFNERQIRSVNDLPGAL